ncbi:MAG: hypothetical protein C0599_00750 [Salinivirgaceae bacterium]|nr:MAG: hypothetical protein C0599_00750 [Salinivirgaceae bacterium]
MKLNMNINDISQTALLTLQCHAADAESQSPILNDKSAVETLNTLKTELIHEDKELHKKLFHSKLKKSLVTHIALRAKQYDHYITEFIKSHPNVTVVNIGCGLDNRYDRVNNGTIQFFDIDLPDIMSIKSQLIPETDNYFQLSQSVFDMDWIEKINTEHVMLVAEGVFMYCKEQDVRCLFSALKTKLNNPHIVFEVFSSKWLKGWKQKLMNFKLRKQLKFEKGAAYQFGIKDSDEIENWSENFKLLEDWSYFDVIKPNSSDFLRKIQWTVYYVIK